MHILMCLYVHIFAGVFRNENTFVRKHEKTRCQPQVSFSRHCPPFRERVLIGLELDNKARLAGH